MIRLRLRSTTPGTDMTVTFTGKLGTAERLGPKDLSEPVAVTFVVEPGRGFDASVDFQVIGRAPRR